MPKVLGVHRLSYIKQLALRRPCREMNERR